MYYDEKTILYNAILRYALCEPDYEYMLSRNG
jgi:hypothetical protein